MDPTFVPPPAPSQDPDPVIGADLAEAIRRDLVHERLDALKAELREAKRVLARDWETLSPRERSSGSRLVKQLETERQALLDSLA